jgi:hypothetical protein
MVGISRIAVSVVVAVTVSALSTLAVADLPPSPGARRVLKYKAEAPFAGVVRGLSVEVVHRPGPHISRATDAVIVKACADAQPVCAKALVGCDVIEINRQAVRGVKTLVDIDAAAPRQTIRLELYCPGPGPGREVTIELSPVNP